MSNGLEDDKQHDNTKQASLTVEPAQASQILQLTPDRFTKKEKWFIVIFTAFVGLFSPLTANIYFPAIPTISKAFNKSTELINLTVTMYMVLQGVAPMLWGPISDHVGRRPISAACLLILTLSCVGLALVPTSDYWLLMILRCLQATGSASTIAIGKIFAAALLLNCKMLKPYDQGAGVIGDISSRAERGGFFGIFTIGPMIGPAIGPVIGGALSERLGWRSIFWFLCIAAALCFIIIILFQPETLPVIEEKNRDAVFLIYRPVIPIIGRRTAEKARITSKNKIPRNPFLLFLNPDVDVLLMISALTCAVFYAVIATISSLFVTTYPYLSETTIGLCFLAMGGGMAIGSSIIGRVLDLEYRRFKTRSEGRLSGTVDLSYDEGFPLEKARLRLMPLFSIVLGVACAGYGWCIERKVNIAVPLILHFLVGFVSISVMNAASTLMIDLVPGQSSSVTACNNLIRCTLSAVFVSVIELIIKAIGTGWTYVIMSLMAFLSIPLIFLAIRIGPQYRVKRRLTREEESSRILEESK